MKALLSRKVIFLLLGLWLASTLGFASPEGHARVATGEARQLYAIVLVHDLPLEARHTLSKIKAGGPFLYRRDGSVFGNRERFLPARSYGYYTEYTVATPGSPDRGARRIVAGAGKERNPRVSGEYYYTDDHYQSFKKIVER